MFSWGSLLEWLAFELYGSCCAVPSFQHWVHLRWAVVSWPQLFCPCFLCFYSIFGFAFSSVFFLGFGGKQQRSLWGSFSCFLCVFSTFCSSLWSFVEQVSFLLWSSVEHFFSLFSHKALWSTPLIFPVFFPLCFLNTECTHSLFRFPIVCHTGLLLDFF